MKILSSRILLLFTFLRGWNVEGGLVGEARYLGGLILEFYFWGFWALLAFFARLSVFLLLFTVISFVHPSTREMSWKKTITSASKAPSHEIKKYEI